MCILNTGGPDEGSIRGWRDHCALPGRSIRPIEHDQVESARSVQRQTNGCANQLQRRVGGPGGAVTSEMLAEQKDPKLMGSPAWWSTHATADGKPLSAEKR